MSKQLEKIKQLIEKREQARLGGGEKAIQKQHDKGKYTARERCIYPCRAASVWLSHHHRDEPVRASR